MSASRQPDVDSSAVAQAMHKQLGQAVDIAMPQTPAQFARHLFIDKWGSHIDPYTARLVTLDYNYKGHSPQDGVHQGRVASDQSVIQALLRNYQTVGDGRFGETGFGLYTPPYVGPPIRIVENVDEFADRGSGNHQTYEGIYRHTEPQTYEPKTQIRLRPADFKQWVWTLELKDLYQAYLGRAWPEESVIIGRRAYPLRTSVKAAFVMSAWLQHQENSLSQVGLELALCAAGLPARQSWASLTLKQLQAPTRLPATIRCGRLKLYRYLATDLWTFRERDGSRILLYVPGNSSPIHEFADAAQLQAWIVAQHATPATRQALAGHFAEDERLDGTFHAGVLTALEGMAVFPRKHRLTKSAGLFNDDGYWDPVEYVGFERPESRVDPFAQLVLAMKVAAQAGVETIRDDAQVNREDLSAFVEPVVAWIDRLGALALFIPGGEALLALAGMIDAGYGLDQVIEAKTPDERSKGLTRMVFGLLNALPLAAQGRGAAAGAEVSRPVEKSLAAEGTAPMVDSALATDSLVSGPILTPPVATATRVELLRGIDPSMASFSDETLQAIGRVSTVDDDMLRLIHAGGTPTPLLADILSRFRLDQALEPMAVGSERSALFNSRYQALQQSDEPWVRLLRRQYRDLPKSVVEQMLDRDAVSLQTPPDADQARRLFSRLDAKARQYQGHVRLNRAYEGLYLRSLQNPESATLALHSLPRVPGWPKGTRIDVLDRGLDGAVLDRCGPLEASDVIRLIRVEGGYARSTSAPAQTLYQALSDSLSKAQREALNLPAAEPGRALERLIIEHAMPRSELMSGLGRMDAHMPFESRGLRGGGFPTTVSGEALTHQMMRLQVQTIYPGFTQAEAEELLSRMGADAQTQIDALTRDLQQLNIDLTAWIDRVAEDIVDMEVPVLHADEPAAQGMNARQIAIHNADQVQTVMDVEHDTRTELAVELVAIWQKRPLQGNRVYANGRLSGYRMDMTFEEYHRLPVLNVRFNEVIELSLRHIQVTDLQSLDAFLDSFPNLRALDLKGVDLRELQTFNDPQQQIGAIPLSITRMRNLTRLDLSECQLTFSHSTASQLTGLARLQDLDLSVNPLQVPPLLLGMDDLRRLNLRSTAIAACPIGLTEQPVMTLLDLRNNFITRLPQNVIDQGIASGRVKLDGNPLADEDTLRRLIRHREETGLNLWLAVPDAQSGEALPWLRDIEPSQQQSRLAIWHRLAARPSGPRFLRVLDGLCLMPDFLVEYPDLQARVWRLLEEADAAQEFWEQMSHDIEVTPADADNPMAMLVVLENRAKLYRDWVALGRPFPIPVT